MVKKKKNLFNLNWKKPTRKSKKKQTPVKPGPVTPKTDWKKMKSAFFAKNQDQISVIRKFLYMVVGYGALINYALYFIFNFNFNIFSLFAWGIAYYFITDEFVEWFRRLIAKR